MTLTQGVVVFAIVGLLVYDAFAGKLKQSTESQVLRDWARDWSLLPFVAGFLLGHWFFPKQQVNWSAWGFALPAFAVLLGVDIFWNLARKGSPIPWWRWSGWYALLGIPAGMYLWGQPGDWSPVP